jgi:protein TorT
MTTSRTMWHVKGAAKALSLGAAAVMLAASPLAAQDAKWWPVEVEVGKAGSGNKVQYEPLEKASKPWHICALYPHLKDSWWLAINYGQVSEAKRQGVKLTVFEAGGYTNLNKQLSQFDDCVALGVDAILISVISEAGIAKKIEEYKDKLVLIGASNPVHEAPVTAKIYTDQELMGYTGGMLAVDYFKGKTARAVQFPGPQGSGWAEESAKGFHRAVDGTGITVLEDKYGDTGKNVQLKLVEDALQTYDDIDLLFGVAVMAEVAVGAVEEAGLADKTKIISWYSNQGMIDGVKKGDILATVTQSPVTHGRIAIDLAVRALEGKLKYKEVHPIPFPITTDNINSLDLTRSFAPADFSPTFKVE